MDDHEHHQAEQEMKLLHFRHLHQRNETQKFVNRLTSMLYKALLLAIALGFLSLLPFHFTAFARYSRSAVVARSWDAVSILLVSFVIFFGFLGRRKPDVQENDRNGNVFYVNSLFESNSSFGDSAPKSIEWNDYALESNGCEDFPQKSDGFEAFSDSGYQSSQNSEVNHAVSLFPNVAPEVTEGLDNKQSLITVDGMRLPPLLPQPPVSINPPLQPPVSINPPLQKDSNMAPPIMRYRSLKRKRRIVSSNLHPTPASAFSASETLFPKQRSKDASGHEKLEKPPKRDKIKSESKNLSDLSPLRPPRPTEDRANVSHESRRRRSKSKEDSQHRTKEDEHKRRRSKHEHKHNNAEDFANAFGVLDRKHTTIPSSTIPPLQQWWSSYQKESKHKNKDSESSLRPHSDISNRNVHSSSSSHPSARPPLPPTSIVDSMSKHQRRVHSSTAPIVEKISKHHRNGGISESNGLSKSRRDETSENKDPINSSKGNRVGDDKVEEDLASWKSSPIHLPPPPPPPPFPVFEHQWPLSNDTKREKRRSSTAESAKSESEAEPEHGRAFAFRKQFSLDNVNAQFCPSPSPDEVNRKADAFIAKVRQQIRLRK